MSQYQRDLCLRHYLKCLIFWGSSANVFCVGKNSESVIFMPTYYISTWRIGFQFDEISTKLVSEALWLMFGNQLLRFEKNFFFFNLGILPIYFAVVYNI